MHKEGKPYVLDALAVCQKILQASDEGFAASESEKTQLQEAGEKLEGVKDKIYLKSKKGLNDAYLMAEAARALEEAFEQLSASDSTPGSLQEDYSAQLSAFVTSVDALHAATKSRSIVIT